MRRRDDWPLWGRALSRTVSAMPMSVDDILSGQAAPIGATVRDGGVNFSIYSKSATAIELLLFEAPDAPLPSRTIRLEAPRHRTYYYWHVFVKELHAGQVYAYRAHGPSNPAEGLRFDGSKVLLDPYARAICDDTYDRLAAQRPGDNCAQALRSVVVDPSDYDWQGDEPLRLPTTGAIIYEMHVGGFTRHPSSGVSAERRGTYAGLIEKIPYLKDLGITAVELLPVQQFDADDAPKGRRNYWGYSPLALFSPHRGYCVKNGRHALSPVNEFRDLVKALHRAGIEVILDVVFNHTAEGNAEGPTLSLRGLDNRAYYILTKDRRHYANYSGCGNTLNAHRSVVRRMILDCLRYWVKAMHVDGFRFDLASVMSRDSDGTPLNEPPILWDIETDPVLVGTKIIAEAWDAAGLYQVGKFIGDRWAEWNGPFRDDVRRFVAGIGESTTGKLAARLSGSRDLYQQKDREPSRCVNFITCHDGFTLRDLVSYERKHNEDNGEENRDGSDENYSWNCGVEGPSDDAQIAALRLRQMKNLLVALFSAQGTPMLQMGDEVCRTQRGNNNAYCQDNELAWFDWKDVEEQAHFLRFVRGLIKLYSETQLFRDGVYWTEPGGTELTWHGVQLERPDWSADSHSLAFELVSATSGERVHVMWNAHREPLSFALPALPPGKRFFRIVDTALPAPADFCDPAAAPPVEGSAYLVRDRAAVVLIVR